MGAGVQEGSVFHIREVIVPQQEWGYAAITVSPYDGAGPCCSGINLHLYKSRLPWLLAQIHSHPTHAFHSEMDDEYAIATALGAFSLVVPDFARDPFSIVQLCDLPVGRSSLGGSQVRALNGNRSMRAPPLPSSTSWRFDHGPGSFFRPRAPECGAGTA